MGSVATYLEGAAATYLEEQWPRIWFTVEIRLSQPQVELERGLSLTITFLRSVGLFLKFLKL